MALREKGGLLQAYQISNLTFELEKAVLNVKESLMMRDALVDGEKERRKASRK